MRPGLRLSLALTVVLFAPAALRATGTSPALRLATATGAVADGARSAAFTGSLDFRNAVQVGYALHLVVFQGVRFVRYPVAGGPVAGDSAELADGVLAQSEVAPFLLEGAAVPPGVRILSLVADGIRVSLPPTLVAGPATALLVAVLPGGVVFSNPIGFVLP